MVLPASKARRVRATSGLIVGVLSFAGRALALEPAAPTEPERSLPELLALAERHAPALRVAARRRGYADAEATDAAGALRHDPTLGFALGPRFEGGGGTDFDFAASLSQPIEIAGEGGLRRAAAERLRARLDAEAGVARWEVRSELAATYGAAVVARARLALLERNAELAVQMHAIAERRLAAGDASAIDLRLAQSALAEARHAQLLGEHALWTLRLRLGELTGAALDAPPQVQRALPAPRAPPDLGAVLIRATERSPELRARRAEEAEARARAELAEREAWPVPAVGATIAREGSPSAPASYVLLGTLELPLPLWRANQGARARARAERSVAEVELEAEAAGQRARIARAHAALATAVRRVTLYASAVNPSLGDGLTLLQRAFDAGELPLLEVVTARERFLRAESAALDAYGEYYAARAELERVAGVELGEAEGRAP